MSRGKAPLLLLLAAALLLAPSLRLGTLISHSSPQNLTWADQFARQFAGGILYPRWLADSFDGLGSPTFYFYPPIGFWVDALVNLATFGFLDVSYRLSLSSLLLLWASGLAMQAWLKTERVSDRAAFYGALGYMAAPYHLLDHYYRGAYAEFAAYAVLPLVALAVRRLADGSRSGVALLAICYAALPMAHLPTSLLISLTALPMYVLYRGCCMDTAKRALGFFLACLAGGVLGMGLAAIYLVPALLLQDWIPVETFWTSSYRVDRWFLLTPGRWPAGAPEMMGIIVSCAAAYVVVALGVVLAQAGEGWRRAVRREGVFWAGVCLACTAVIAGLVPWFWKLPFVAEVQFPWRLMIVVEFAAITAVCTAPWTLSPRARLYTLLLALIVLAPGLATLGDGIGIRVQATVKHVSDPPADLKQFLPAHYPQKPDGGYAELSLGPVEHLPTIACTPVPALCRATDARLGELDIDIDGEAATSVVVRRFAYPFWKLDPGMAITATQPLQLVSFIAPPGRHTYRLTHTPVRAEKMGWAISAAALAILLGVTALARRRIGAGTGSLAAT